MDVDAAVARARERAPHCFGCGERNPYGLRLTGFRPIPGGVAAPFTPRPEHAGFDGVLHGGVIATALDEIMAWTAILDESVAVVTATLDLRFRRPAPVDAAYRLEGTVTDRTGRRLRISGRMTGPAGTVADASGLFVAAAAIEPD